jgi:hypothetical protein
MSSFISRGNTLIKININAGGYVSEPFNMGDYAGGTLLNLGKNWKQANIGFLISHKIDGEYAILRDEDGNTIQLKALPTDSSFAVNLPDQLFPCFFVKLWSKSNLELSSDDIPQDVNQEFIITLKG